ncbi:MAG: metabolite traffic protein EboE [Ktedonobacteraceae bacterium]|nr:metabolite traffic protein EboE [Ktedonobacteraceae bacterium]
MHIENDNFFSLTYCTNIHPGNGWDEVYTNLQEYAPALKSRFAPHKAFGIGLRLSGRESSELLRGDHLLQLRDFLQSQGLYVFTLNGFPYGPFHQQPVKAEVHAPDWRDEERVAYTQRLIEILAFLLPDGVEGGISTSPLSYKAWIDTQDVSLWRHFTHNVVRIAETLVRVKRERGKFIHLDIEPEPDGLLENSEEVVEFYTHWLLEEGASLLSDALHVSREEARNSLLEHIQICFDTCHVAVAYEEPEAVLERFNQFGIKIGKVQISSALKVAFSAEKAERVAIGRALQPFVESTYLHQVIQQNRDATFSHYPDLSEALPHIQDPEIAQWRIHFHVPIFIDSFPAFQSTQDTIVETLKLLMRRRFSRHLEIETYTWSVLPEELKEGLLDSIAREYEWVLGNAHE